MKAIDRDVVRDLLLLSLAAGSADAAGFIGLGHVFTSNMTGNIVLLGLSAGQGHFAEATRSLYVLLVFLTGACLGSWLSRHIDANDWLRLARRVIGPEAVLLTLFAVLWCLLSPQQRTDLAYLLIASLALAMGLQATAMHHLNVPGAGTTAVTGTLTGLVRSTLSAFGSAAAPVSAGNSARTRMIFQAGVVGLYLGGAIISGALILYLPRLVGFFPAALAWSVVFIGSWRSANRL